MLATRFKIRVDGRQDVSIDRRILQTLNPLTDQLSQICRGWEGDDDKDNGDYEDDETARRIMMMTITNGAA